MGGEVMRKWHEYSPPLWNTTTHSRKSDNPKLPLKKKNTKWPINVLMVFSSLGLAILILGIMPDTDSIMRASGTTNTVEFQVNKPPKIKDETDQTNGHTLLQGQGRDGIVSNDEDAQGDINSTKMDKNDNAQSNVQKLSKLQEPVHRVSYNIENTGEKDKQQKSWYRVRKDWNDPKPQIGAFKNLKLAKLESEKSANYKVYDSAGNIVYDPKAKLP